MPCTRCTPCRAGNFLVRRKLDKIKRGLARDQDLEDIIKWGEIMRDTSRCGLGKTATRSLCIALDKFSEDLKRSESEEVALYNRGFSLDEAVKEYELFNN